MIEVEKNIGLLKEKLNKIRSVFDLPGKKEKIKKLEEETSRGDLWNNPDEARELLQKLNDLKEITGNIDSLEERIEEINLYQEMANEGEPGAEEELEGAFNSLSDDINVQETATLLSGEYDQKSAILTVHTGAGGVDAQDWAEILLRMYLRWAEKKKFKTRMIEVSGGEEAGIKSATAMVDGQYAYGFLKCEKGVHRLVRISPFDSAHRRHTSFAQVEVTPQIDDTIEVEIKDDDLKIDTYRASGAGGQHVNKTNSAVRITHLPTGVVVQCQNERSQYSNKNTAMKILKARLFEKELEEKERKLAQIRGEHMDIAWGSQIRSYVMHPYTMVKDHRTSTDSGNMQVILDGGIDLFIKSYLEYKVRGASKG
ncbi:MAG: peptide chain release factor 2 [Candidatus Eremiobacteraeota bacterium]|nr:peptide chain release factor 2 [Candidatus Eremiobacteraeota bacterium]